MQIIRRSLDNVGTVDCGLRSVDLERIQSLQPKDGVIEIAFAAAIIEAAVGVLLVEQKAADQSGRVAEKLGGQPRHLEHLQPQAHDCPARGQARRKAGELELPGSRVVNAIIVPSSRRTPLAAVIRANLVSTSGRRKSGPSP